MRGHSLIAAPIVNQIRIWSEISDLGRLQIGLCDCGACKCDSVTRPNWVLMPDPLRSGHVVQWMS